MAIIMNTNIIRGNKIVFKRCTFLLLVAIMMFSFTGCSAKTPEATLDVNERRNDQSPTEASPKLDQFLIAVGMKYIQQSIDRISQIEAQGGERLQETTKNLLLKHEKVRAFLIPISDEVNNEISDIISGREQIQGQMEAIRAEFEEEGYSGNIISYVQNGGETYCDYQRIITKLYGLSWETAVLPTFLNTSKGVNVAYIESEDNLFHSMATSGAVALPEKMKDDYIMLVTYGTLNDEDDPISFLVSLERTGTDMVYVYARGQTEYSTQSFLQHFGDMQGKWYQYEEIIAAQKEYSEYNWSGKAAPVDNINTFLLDIANECIDDFVNKVQVFHSSTLNLSSSYGKERAIEMFGDIGEEIYELADFDDLEIYFWVDEMLEPLAKSCENPTCAAVFTGRLVQDSGSEYNLTELITAYYPTAIAANSSISYSYASMLGALCSGEKYYSVPEHWEEDVYVISGNENSQTFTLFCIWNNNGILTAQYNVLQMRDNESIAEFSDILTRYNDTFGINFAFDYYSPYGYWDKYQNYMNIYNLKSN